MKYTDEKIEEIILLMKEPSARALREMDDFDRTFYPLRIRYAQREAAQAMPVLWKEVLRLRRAIQKLRER